MLDLRCSAVKGGWVVSSPLCASSWMLECIFSCWLQTAFLARLLILAVPMEWPWLNDMQMEWRQNLSQGSGLGTCPGNLQPQIRQITQRHILLSQQKSPNINKNQQKSTNHNKRLQPLGSRRWQERHQREQPPVPHPKVHVSFVQDSKEE